MIANSSMSPHFRGTDKEYFVCLNLQIVHESESPSSLKDFMIQIEEFIRQLSGIITSSFIHQ